MLLLKRKIGEKIIIDTGNDIIQILIGDLSYKEAKIGIEAPRNIVIIRNELADKIDSFRDRLKIG